MGKSVLWRDNMEVNVRVGEPKEPSGVIVLVDVYKSSTSITTALDNGAKFVLPFGTEEEARKAGKKWKEKEDTILAGENMGVKIKDFDTNISPREMNKETVKNKVVIYKSDNLTRIISNIKDVEEIIIGGLINSRAVGEYLKNKQPEKVEIIACGTYNKETICNFLKIPCDNKTDFTMEDIIGAGAITHYLKDENLSDKALISLLSYENPEWKEKISRGCIIRALREAGLEEDIPYCFAENNTRTIPRLEGNKIVPLHPN